MMKLSDEERTRYLNPTPYIDSDSEPVVSYVNHITCGLSSDKEKAMAIFNAVRDDILYDPYYYDLGPNGMRASSVLKKGRGYCVAKALVFTAVARAAGIPARLGFADVKNHLSTRRLRELMGTDLFVYHGYSEIFLNAHWIKVTPTFNATLCEKFGVHPLEFDGENDCLFHPFDTQGRKHMEYVLDRGPYDDVPMEEIINASLAAYPTLFKNLDSLGGDGKIGDFSREAELETLSHTENQK
ncbi:transglutaminase family protein [Desulfoluna sp.]|uniref:transglutaminase-like domain-containing protein n=1 Tax=Desulfoluna sp. TaxID=2045199 RepID=UPI00261AE4D0|nr:transglutaminase family protein [Desulfoluna sp.]